MPIRKNLKIIIAVLLMLMRIESIFAEDGLGNRNYQLVETDNGSVNYESTDIPNKRVVTYAEQTEKVKRAEVSGSGIKFSVGGFFDFSFTDYDRYDRYVSFGLEGGVSVGTRNFRDFFTVKTGASFFGGSRARFDFAIGGQNSFMFKVHSTDSDYNVGWLGPAVEYMYVPCIQHSISGLIDYRGQFTSLYWDVGVGYRWHSQNSDSVVVNVSAGYSM